MTKFDKKITQPCGFAGSRGLVNCQTPDYDVCEIADMLEEDERVIQQICDAARKYAPDYDEKNCAELLERIESV